MYLAIAIISLLFIILCCYKFHKFFNRDPEREIPLGNNVVAPADGKIIEIMDIDMGEDIQIDKGLLGRIKSISSDLDSKHLTFISIFMNPAVVHVQRMPVKGTIKDVKHKDGSLRVTNTLKAIDNERAEILIRSSIGMLKVIQIAGLVVRRIETWLKPGQETVTGERLGRINYGSQVCLILPRNENIIIKAKIGDRVKAGISILGEFNK